MRKICVAFALAVLLFTTGLVFGEETTATTVSTVVSDGSVKIPDILVPLIGIVLSGCAALITWGLSRLIGLAIKDKEGQIKYQAAIDALQLGVEEAQIALIRTAKAASSDGKLTKEEIAEAQKLAYQHALRVAQGPAFDLLKTWGFDTAKGYISRIVDKRNDTDTKIV